MSKIDLIIDYLDSIGEMTFASQGFAGVERLNKALAAARELKEMKPVVWQHLEGRNIPLYALDEVTK
jgi:hypothetical protein